MNLTIKSHSFRVPLSIMRTRLFSHFLKDEISRSDLKAFYSVLKKISKEYKGLTVLSIEESGNTVLTITL